MGYSVGHWDGDTIVVDSIGLNDRAWLDAFGHPRSESMHITERYRRRDFGHMDLEITFNDPKYYTRHSRAAWRQAETQPILLTTSPLRERPEAEPNQYGRRVRLGPLAL